MLESVSLELWTTEGENIEIELEPWQTEAIVILLGLKVISSTEEPNAYDIVMSTQNTVQKRLKKLVEIDKKENNIK